MTNKLKLLASVLVATAPFATMPAHASDLGGTCCADLEERIAELESTTARKSNTKVSLTVGGHVNQALLWHNVDELDNQYSIVDNENSESRFRFKGAAKINADWAAGFMMEFGLSGAVNAGDDIDIRHSFVWIRSKQLGTFKLGTTSTATDGIVEISTSAAATSSTLGSLAPFDSFVARQALVTIGPVSLSAQLDNPFDGGRKQAAVWVSPTFGGFSASAAWSDDDSWDVALRYANEFGQMRVAAGVGYRDETQSNGRKFVGGSGSIMHMPSGLFVDIAGGQSDGPQTANIIASAFGLTATIPVVLADTEVTLMGGRVGVETRINKMGKTTLFGEFQQLEIDGVDISPKIWGLGAVQRIDAAAMELYISYRNIDLDTAIGGVEQADVIVSGVKIKF